MLDQLFSALRAANYGPKNAERHVEWCRQFILFHGKRHPRDLDATDVQRFLDHLAVEQKLAVAWQREAAGALAFLYRQVLGMERGLPEVGRVRDGPPNGAATQGDKKLLDRVRDALRLWHYSLRTEQCYVSWITRYILFHNKRHPAEMGGREIEEFLTDLAVRGHVSASTQTQALNALVFLYKQVLAIELPRLDAVRARRPRRLPVVMSRAEVRQVLEAIEGCGALYPLMARLMYRPIAGRCRPGHAGRRRVASSPEPVTLAAGVRVTGPPASRRGRNHHGDGDEIGDQHAESGGQTCPAGILAQNQANHHQLHQRRQTNLQRRRFEPVELASRPSMLRQTTRSNPHVTALKYNFQL